MSLQAILYRVFLGASLALSAPGLGAAVFDLNGDWSDSANPNGRWSYNDGAGPITVHQNSWFPAAYPIAQPAWAYNTGPDQGHIVAWFK
jgi:hypothetical protein